MQRLRKSVQGSYRHNLPSAMREFISVPLAGLGDLPGRRRWRWQYLVYTALLMVWDTGRTLGDRFDSARSVVVRRFARRRRPGGTYQGLMTALLAVTEVVVERLAEHLRGCLRALAGAAWQQQGLLAFTPDGSRIDCPRTAANEAALGRSGRDKSGPQFWVTALYHMGLGLLWDYRIGGGRDSERKHLRGMLDALPAACWVVADAGFTGYELLRAIVAGGRHFLVRVGRNVRLLRELGYAQVEDDGTVYLWPDKSRRAGQVPLVLRLIVVRGHGRPVYLLTDDVMAEQLTVEKAGVLYRLRWGVEVFFRSFKQTLERRKMLSRAPRQGRCELQWSVMGLWLLEAMGVKAILARGGNPLSLSVALALRRVRQAMAQRVGAGKGRWSWTLAGAVKDTYCRRGSKQARDWPHKKNEPPAGEPQIARATPRQVQQAQAVRLKQTAA